MTHPFLLNKIYFALKYNKSKAVTNLISELKCVYTDIQHYYTVCLCGLTQNHVFYVKLILQTKLILK